jgi:hypothetical protein
LENVLSLNVSVTGNEGDTFAFKSNSSSDQFHFEVSTSDPDPHLGLWKGSAEKGNGVAMNKPGRPYIDHVCGQGRFVLTVGAKGPVSVKVTKNSWWKKVFGIG